jgi:hypothetical protein
MGRPCAACTSPKAQQINQRLRSGVTVVDVVRWLREVGEPISRNALSRHKPHVGLGPGTPGPRPRSDDFLRDVVDTAHEDLSTGVLRPSIRDALGAQSLLEQRKQRDLDKDIWAKVSWALVGRAVPAFPVPRDPELEALEAEFTEYLAGEIKQIPADIRVKPSL